jgi:hypothetical protein
MSLFDPQRHFATVNCRSAKGSFGRLVGAHERRRWHVEPIGLMLIRLYIGFYFYSGGSYAG